MLKSGMGKKVSIEGSLGTLFETGFETEVVWEGTPLFFGFLLNCTLFKLVLNDSAHIEGFLPCSYCTGCVLLVLE